MAWINVSATVQKDLEPLYEKAVERVILTTGSTPIKVVSRLASWYCILTTKSHFVEYMTVQNNGISIVLGRE